MRLTIGHDLDAHDVAGLEEVLPGFDGVGRAGEFLDPAVHGGLDRGGVAHARATHDRVAHFDDLAGKNAGQRELGLGRLGAALVDWFTRRVRALGIQERRHGQGHGRCGHRGTEKSATACSTAM